MADNPICTLAIGAEIIASFNQKGWTPYRLRGQDSFDLFSPGPAIDILYTPVLERTSPFYTLAQMHPNPRDAVAIQFELDELEERGLYPPRLEKPDKSKTLPFLLMSFCPEGMVILGSYDLGARRFSRTAENTLVNYSRLLKVIETDLQPDLRKLRVVL